MNIPFINSNGIEHNLVGGMRLILSVVKSRLFSDRNTIARIQEIVKALKDLVAVQMVDFSRYSVIVYSVANEWKVDLK